MNVSNLPILKMHKLTNDQFNRAFEAENIDEHALYLTPDIVPDVIIDKTDTVTKVDFINFGETTSVKTIEVPSYMPKLPSKARVGQFLMVKAIDEHGRPSELGVVTLSISVDGNGVIGLVATE